MLTRSICYLQKKGDYRFNMGLEGFFRDLVADNSAFTHYSYILLQFFLLGYCKWNPGINQIIFYEKLADDIVIWTPGGDDDPTFIKAICILPSCLEAFSA